MVYSRTPKGSTNTKNKLAWNLGFPGIAYLYARKTMVKGFVWLLALMVVTAACLDEPDCYNLNNDVIGISFKKLEDSRTDTVSLVAFGVVEPPLLAGLDTTISRAFMLLNYFEDETTFFFDPSDTVHHFLRLGYVSQAQFVSENCGEKFVLSELQILETTYDSVRLVRDTPNSQGGIIHIEIFQ